MSKTIQTLTPEQSSKLVDWFDERVRHKVGGRHSCRNSLICLLLLDAGLRVGELTQLIISDVWFDDHPVLTFTIRASTTKTQTERNVPLSMRITRAIRNYRQSRDHIVFDNPINNLFPCGQPRFPISTRQVERIIRTAGQAALGIRVHPHMLRHTFATRLMQKTNIRVVQALLGHASLQSTQIYTHPNDQDLKKAIDSME